MIKTIIKPQELQEDSKVMGSVENFFRKFNMGTLLNQGGIRKTKGVSPGYPDEHFFIGIYQKKFFRGIVSDESESFGKDAAYEFPKCPCYNWRKVILTLAAKIFSFFNSLTNDAREKVLIIDDSTYDRSRSKKVELLAKVYDHAQGKFIRGFGMLTVCRNADSLLV